MRSCDRREQCSEGRRGKSEAYMLCYMNWYNLLVYKPDLLKSFFDKTFIASINRIEKI